jgi:hypothetical protein
MSETTEKRPDGCPVCGGIDGQRKIYDQQYLYCLGHQAVWRGPRITHDAEKEREQTISFLGELDFFDADGDYIDTFVNTLPLDS